MNKRQNQLMPQYSWWKFHAPVVPPLWVIEKVVITGLYIQWQNYFWDGKVASAMFYHTRITNEKEKEWYDDNIITHLLPCSPFPATNWLKRIPYSIRKT